jgi:hypothetical protein
MVVPIDGKAEPSLHWGDVRTEFMPVERHGGFQAECVTGTETGRLKPIRLPRLKQLFPDSLGVFGGDDQFAPVFTGVARATHEAGESCQIAVASLVVLEGGQVGQQQRRYESACSGALHGDHGRLAGDIVDFDGEVAPLKATPVDNPLPVPGIDNQPVVGCFPMLGVFRKAVDEHIVENASVRLTDKGVPDLPWLHSTGGPRGDSVEERGGIATVEVESTHVGDVKHAGRSTDRMMFFEDRGKLHRHSPAGELDDSRPGTLVPTVEWRLEEGSSGHGACRLSGAD